MYVYIGDVCILYVQDTSKSDWLELQPFLDRLQFSFLPMQQQVQLQLPTIWVAWVRVTVQIAEEPFREIHRAST